MPADKVTLERIKTLHPKIRQKVLDAYNHINEKLLGKGIRLRLSYTFRTPEEQNALYALGRTKVNPDGKSARKPKGNIVTNAAAWQSIHNYGLAFDIVILYDLNGDGVFETASWDMLKDFDRDGEADWMEVTDYFKSIGFTWGGDWNGFKDNPHFQDDYRLSWRQMKNKVDLGAFTSETINGYTYKYITIDYECKYV